MDLFIGILTIVAIIAGAVIALYLLGYIATIIVVAIVTKRARKALSL